MLQEELQLLCLDNVVLTLWVSPSPMKEFSILPHPPLQTLSLQI